MTLYELALKENALYEKAFMAVWSKLHWKGVGALNGNPLNFNEEQLSWIQSIADDLSVIPGAIPGGEKK